jgi:hypothetical protein
MTPARRQRLLLIATVSVLGLLLLDRVAFTPLLAHWRSAALETATLRRNLAAGAVAVQNAAHARQRWQEVQAAALPAEVGQAEQIVLSSLNQWGQGAGVAIGSITPQWKRGADNRYSTLECRVDATGSLGAVTRFLQSIELSTLALRVDSVELGTRDDRGQKMAATFIVSGLRLQPLEARP